MPRISQPVITEKILTGNTLEVLKTLPERSVHCCITSPPYWGLRDYGTGEWEGGDPKCDHQPPQQDMVKAAASRLNLNKDPNKIQSTLGGSHNRGYKEICKKCGAHRIDSQIGLEKTPEEYVTKIVAVFREVRRVLRDDGTLWLNLGDSYGATSNRNGLSGSGLKQNKTADPRLRIKTGISTGLAQKNLVGIPWRVAFALQADGWCLRQDIIWLKPNPMPESVTDRCTKSHEYIFLLAKSQKYYFDSGATKEMGADFGERNLRSVWTVATKPFKEAHFAVYPLNLIRPCILAGCPPKGTILDPFLGSGTTAVGAVVNGRGYVGIELNPEYVKMAKSRLARVKERIEKNHHA